MAEENKYIGFRWALGTVMAILLGIVLFVPPYIIQLYLNVLNGESSQYLPILPETLYHLFDIFDIALMNFNSKLFAAILIPFVFIKKKTLARIIINVLVVLLLIYGLFIGSNLFTLGLPLSGFANMQLNLDLISMLGGSMDLGMADFVFSFNYGYFAILMIIIAILGTMKSVFQFLDRYYSDNDN